MTDWIYVDNSNVFIEGQRVSAVRSRYADNISHSIQNKILDYDYRMCFYKLFSFVAGESSFETARAKLFGSRPPENDAIWKIAERAGFEVITEDRNVANKEKKIDTGIVAALMRDAYRDGNKAEDVFTIVAGDGDYVPAVKSLLGDDFKVEVVFWDHASQELKRTASKFISLDPHLNALRA